MRRYMMRIAGASGRGCGSTGFDYGESIGQVASQTMQSLAATDAACTMPVFRPVIGFDKQEIVDVAEKRSERMRHRFCPLKTAVPSLWQSIRLQSRI